MLQSFSKPSVSFDQSAEVLFPKLPNLSWIYTFNIVAFNSAPLTSHNQHSTAQVLIDSHKADFNCILETHSTSRDKDDFIEYNTPTTMLLF